MGLGVCNHHKEPGHSRSCEHFWCIPQCLSIPGQAVGRCWWLRDRQGMDGQQHGGSWRYLSSTFMCLVVPTVSSLQLLCNNRAYSTKYYKKPSLSAPIAWCRWGCWREKEMQWGYQWSWRVSAEHLGCSLGLCEGSAQQHKPSSLPPPSPHYIYLQLDEGNLNENKLNSDPTEPYNPML